ncbi:MAG TPA: peptidase S9 [Candidatus Moranbacteria bacterium]|nr:peptidase S9 [Candidatus Moranbacteria bacterium]
MKIIKYLLLIILISGLAWGLFFFIKPSTEKNQSEIQPETYPEQNELVQNAKKPEEHPDSIPAMSEKEYHGSDLKLEKVLEDNASYARYSISYLSEGFKISGIMNIPKGAGPFPVLILNHGYIDPKFYTNGQGLKREQDFFARHGYAVLHSDYRNYAQSDFDPQNEIRPRSGYVEDVINAIEAVKKSDLQVFDKENIGMLGHSMGGGIALNVMVIKPDIAKAYVLLAPINSDYKVNFDKWVRSDWSDTAREFIEKYGEPQENPELWNSLSAKNYFYRVSSPVMLHQGTADDQVPVEWSRELDEMLKKENKAITYYEYPGESHTFTSAQNLVMQRTLEFLDSRLK